MLPVVHQYFLMITSDPDLIDDRPGFALELVESRLEKAQWPLYGNTQNRKRISAGDLLAFYVAGSGPRGGSVVATAAVNALRQWRRRADSFDAFKYLTATPEVVLELNSVRKLSEPVLLRAVLEALTIRPSNLQKWGSALQGGCRQITAADWKLLTGIPLDVTVG